MVKSKKGFTLAELLIVVAIISVLVAISIPIFTSQLKKAILAVDHSAMRDAYALAQIANNMQEVEIDGTIYTFDELRKDSESGKCRLKNFYLTKDCNSFVFSSEGVVDAPEGAYVFKENGCEESNSYFCETCNLWGVGGYHFKNSGIHLNYDSVKNLIVFY